MSFMWRSLPEITDFSLNRDFCLKTKKTFQKIKGGWFFFFAKPRKNTLATAILPLLTVWHSSYTPSFLSHTVGWFQLTDNTKICPLAGSAQGQFGRGFEKPGLVEGVSAHGMGVGTRWCLSSLPLKTILSFYKNLKDAFVIYWPQHCTTVWVYHFSQTPWKHSCSNKIYSLYLETCRCSSCTSTERLILFQINCMNAGILRLRTLQCFDWGNIR